MANGTDVWRSALPNGTDGDSEDLASTPLFQGYSDALLHFAAACCVVFIAVGVPGNLVTIVALLRCRKVRNATAVFIVNLSVSDLLLGCVNLPLAAQTFLLRRWPHGALMCHVFPLLRYALVAVSLLSVLAITLNRYVLIAHPAVYPKVYKSRHLALMVAAIWVLSFAALAPTWVERWGRFGLDAAIGSCSIVRDAAGRSPKEFLFVAAFLLPAAAIVLCYARIYCIVRHSGARAASTRPAATNSTASLKAPDQGVGMSRRPSSSGLPACQPARGRMSSKDRRLLKMILVIFASFLICYLPITVSKTFHSSLDLHTLNIAGYILIYLSTCINPFIYVVMSSEYRQAYRDLLLCRASGSTGTGPAGSGIVGPGVAVAGFGSQRTRSPRA